VLALAELSGGALEVAWGRERRQALAESAGIESVSCLNSVESSGPPLNRNEEPLL
jgi:hypothetical protein